MVGRMRMREWSLAYNPYEYTYYILDQEFMNMNMLLVFFHHLVRLAYSLLIVTEWIVLVLLRCIAPEAINMDL